MWPIEIGELDDPHAAEGGGSETRSLVMAAYATAVPDHRLRLGVYTDYAYELIDGDVYAERAFALFLARLRSEFASLTVIGRVRPVSEGKARYPLGRGVAVLPLPFYASLAHPLRTLGPLARSLRVFWRGLDELDAVWLLGPHPLAIAFALMALARRKRVVLGVRQDLPAYANSRHPGRPAMAAVARVLETSFRLLGRFCGVVVVGPDLAANYRRSRDVCEIVVSLIDKDSIVTSQEAAAREYEGELTMLSVGRLDTEKNPLLIIDVVERLEAQEPGRWRLRICGEGPAEDEIRARIAASGLEERCDLLGYLRWGDELEAEYRRAHALIHISKTEGFPQVLIEAFAAGLPVVATAVGGISGAIGDAALLIEPDDPGAAADALAEIASNPGRRKALTDAGRAFVSEHTLDAEAERVASFIGGGS